MLDSRKRGLLVEFPLRGVIVPECQPVHTRVVVPEALVLYGLLPISIPRDTCEVLGLLRNDRPRLGVEIGLGLGLRLRPDQA